VKARVRSVLADFKLFCCALISSNLESARSNLGLKSHMHQEFRGRSQISCPVSLSKGEMLLFRRYPMILGSEIL